MLSHRIAQRCLYKEEIAEQSKRQEGNLSFDRSIIKNE